jgi:hypothetical protein
MFHNPLDAYLPMNDTVEVTAKSPSRLVSMVSKLESWSSNILIPPLIFMILMGWLMILILG